MNRKHRVLWAYLLAMVLTLSFVLPAAVASQSGDKTAEGQTKDPVPQTAGTETESEGLGQSLEDTGEAISQVISKGYDLSLDISLTEPMQNYLSDITKGADMSWAKEAAFTGTSAGNEDGGIDASGVLSLNGTELYHGRASIDLDDGLIYLVCPEFRKTPFVFNAEKAAESARQAAKKSSAGKKAEKAAKNFKSDYPRLANEAREFFSSLTEKEMAEFAGRYADVFTENWETSSHENITLTAGALSESIDTTTITVSQDAMAKILKSSRNSLKTDVFVKKILTSDFALDLTNTILTEAKLGSSIDRGGLYKGYESLLAMADDDTLAKVPGFTLTYGLSPDGRIADVEFGVLYLGASVNVFTLKMLSRETHLSMQFDLGGIVSALIAQNFGGDANGETGILLEADTAGGEFYGNFTLKASGRELAVLSLEDFLIDDVRKGMLNGTASLTLGDAAFEAELASEKAGTGTITGRYNGTDYLTLTASAEATDKAKVDKINRKKAMEVYDMPSWYAYIKDASLDKMIRKLGKGGVSEDILGMLTSGEAGTEKSRENTDENDGTGELANGEVGGADIGNTKAD